MSDEDDDVDMKDELDLRHEGMSKCEHVRGPHIGEPERRQLGGDLVEYSKFDVWKQYKDCVDLHKTRASLDKQSSITVTIISQVLQYIGNMYHEFMQLIDGAKGAFPAARNTNLSCIPTTHIETKPWSLFGEESEAQLLASFTEYAERNDLQLLLWTFCNQKGEIALVCSKTMGGNTVALAIRTPGSQDDFAKEVARIMGNRCQQWQTDAMCGRHQKSTTLVCWCERHPVHGWRSRRTTQIGYLHH